MEELTAMPSLRNEAWYLYRCLRLGSAFFKRRLIHCNLQVTYRCNFRCQICDFWRQPHPKSEEFTPEQVRVVGEKLARLGTMIVSLGGGEPLIREDLYQLTTILRDTGHFPILITNGWFVNESVARDILRAGLQEISVSVDYADPARHDAQRGCPGAWDRAVKALELLHRHRPDRRCRVHMISVLMDDNLEDIEKLLRLARDIGVTYYVNLYSSGRGTKSPRLPGSEVQHHLLDLKRRYPEFVSLTSYIESFDRAIREGGIGGCEGGTLFLNVGSGGGVSRCIDTLEDQAGNILTDDILAIRYRLARLRTGKPCAECWTSCRGFAECMYQPPRARQFAEFYTSVKRR
jgi:MoaA/NifB/PqqE/SkfB family radical SAM enzyme